MKGKLLMVDDSEVDILLVENALSEIAAEVNFFSFNNPENFINYLNESLEIDLQSHWVVVLLDINMPRMNGFEVLNVIRKTKNLLLLPIVMFSTSNNREDAIKSFKEGANAYLTKPLVIDEYRQLVQSTLNFWQHNNAQIT